MRLIDHGGGVLRLGAVQFLIGRDAAGPEAEVEPALGQVIEERQPAGDVGRVVLIETNGGRTQADAARLSQGASDEDLRHHDVLVLHRVMLADPELAEAQLLGLHDQLQVLVVALRRRLGRVVERHDEHAVTDRLHSVVHARFPSLSGRAGSVSDRSFPPVAHAPGSPFKPECSPAAGRPARPGWDARRGRTRADPGRSPGSGISWHRCRGCGRACL